MVHLDRLDFGGDTSGGEGDNHTGLDDTSLNTTDGHSSNTTDLVDILEGKTERLVRGSDGGLDGVDGVEEGLALNSAGLGLFCPAFVPRHAVNEPLDSKKKTKKKNENRILGRLFDHVVAVPAGDGDEGDGLGVVADLLDEGGGLLDDFVETVLTPL